MTLRGSLFQKYVIYFVVLVSAALIASGASARLRARTTASPITRMDTSVGMAGGSLADEG